MIFFFLGLCREKNIGQQETITEKKLTILRNGTGKEKNIVKN